MTSTFQRSMFAFLPGAVALGSLMASALPAGATPTAKIVKDGRAVGQAVVINGVPYVRAADVSAMTGLKSSYNSKTRTLTFGASGGNTGTGGTTQRSGNEGPFGRLLVTPIVAIQLQKGVAEDEYGKSVTVFRGFIRNTSNAQRTYEMHDAIVVTGDGNTVKFDLRGNEVGNSSLVTLQRGEQAKLQIAFRDAGSTIDRAVVTIMDWNNKKQTVFRVHN